MPDSWLVRVGKYHARCTTHSGSYPAGDGDHCHVSKVLVLLICCWIKPNAHVHFRVWRSDPQKAGPLGAGELPQQCPMWVDHTGGQSLCGGAQVGPQRCDRTRLNFTIYYAWPKTNSETKARCPRYSGSDGSDGKWWHHLKNLFLGSSLSIWNSY